MKIYQRKALKAMFIVVIFVGLFATKCLINFVYLMHNILLANVICLSATFSFKFLKHAIYHRCCKHSDFLHFDTSSLSLLLLLRCTQLTVVACRLSPSIAVYVISFECFSNHRPPATCQSRPDHVWRCWIRPCHGHHVR